MVDRRVRILLVDDDEADFFLVREWLAEAGEPSFDLDWVPTYDQGLEAIGRNEHDLYLVDYVLGADNGLELLRETRRRGCKAPIIVLTGKGNPDVEKEAIESGAVDYLDKRNIDPADLARCIRRAMK